MSVKSLTGRKRSNAVWRHFKYESVTNKSLCIVSGNDVNEGKVCGRLIAGKNSTNLLSHLKHHHPPTYEEVSAAENDRKKSVEGNPTKRIKTERGKHATSCAIQDLLESLLPELSDRLNEGKTKIIVALKNDPGLVLIESKDRITAGDGARAHDLEGKAAISTSTTSDIFNMLNNAGVKTHFIRQQSEKEFIARRCDMIPIEFVTRRVATGSFLKRNPGVAEGFRFCPPKLEFFFKDDANHDPQWSYEQIIAAKMNCGGVVIGADELDIICKTTVCVFEILERAWASVDCALIDMKIEFGVDVEKKEILLADIIDSDSWRLWPSGDRRLMKDKQVYRELDEVTPEALEVVKKNFAWIGDKVKMLAEQKPSGRVAVLMGSSSDKEFGKKIQDKCLTLGILCELRVTSAHKGTDTTLKILSEYEGDGIPTVFVAVAGRSNGLGPVLSGSSTWPVINCPPLSGEWGPYDLWSSLRMPSGLGCSTVLSPEAAALQAAQIFALSDHVIWGRLRASQLNTWIGLRHDDALIHKQ